MQDSTFQSTPANATQTATEIFLHQLLADFWRARFAILLTSVVCMLAAAAAAWYVPKKYESTVLLSPVVGQPNGNGLGALGSAVSQLGGITSLAGLPISGSGGAKEVSLATLQSVALTERYIQENNLLPILFASQWDSTQQKWKTTDPKRMPTLWKGTEYFAKKIRSEREGAKTGLATLTIVWKDPDLAARWANGLVRMTNDYLRAKAITESDRNIAYLNEQVAKTSVVELRNSIYSLMESEIKKQMIARGSEEYALKVVDPAVVPERAVSPQPVLWVSAAFCLGVLMSGAFLTMRRLMSSEQRRVPGR